MLLFYSEHSAGQPVWRPTMSTQALDTLPRAMNINAEPQLGPACQLT